MTQLEAARIAARAVALYMLVLVASELLSFPQQFMMFCRAMQVATSSHASIGGAAEQGRVRAVFFDHGSYFLTIVLRICLYVAVSLSLYRFGPRIQRFFTNQAE